MFRTLTRHLVKTEDHFLSNEFFVSIQAEVIVILQCMYTFWKQLIVVANMQIIR